MGSCQGRNTIENQISENFENSWEILETWNNKYLKERRQISREST